MQFRLEKVLRIMREFMTHSNQTAHHAYTVVRAQRKTMVVHVRHDSVQVRAPLFVSDAQIKDFVARHSDWIRRKLEHKADQEVQRLVLADGGRIYYKARNLTVRFVTAPRDDIVVTDKEFRIHGRGLNAEAAARILQRWLLVQARTLLPPRTKALATYLQVGSKLKEVVFRKTKTKWGHCTSSGRIQFNWLIMMAPDAVIDYMIAHEVSHLLHMNHSKRFWSIVESVCPDYRTYVTWLKKHEHRLWV
ncbi:MAG: SprT family zinc-dependent metalloprotease [Pseudomonadota bacterium]